MKNMTTVKDPINAAIDHIAKVAGKLPDIQSAIVALLLSLNAPVDRDGFGYLRVAIESYMKNPNQMITKELYPEIAQVFNRECGEIQIERTIRSTIAVIWQNCDPEVWNIFFPKGCAGHDAKPSNLQFVSRLAYLVFLWNSSRNER